MKNKIFEFLIFTFYLYLRAIIPVPNSVGLERPLRACFPLKMPKFNYKKFSKARKLTGIAGVLLFAASRRIYRSIKKHPAFRQGVIFMRCTAITEENRKVRVHISG